MVASVVLVGFMLRAATPSETCLTSSDDMEEQWWLIYIGAATSAGCYTRSDRINKSARRRPAGQPRRSQPTGKETFPGYPA